MSTGIPVNNINSLKETSIGSALSNELENPNMAFIQERKKKDGAKRYKNNNKKIEAEGKRSKKKEKKRNSETKNIDPGKPKKISIFNSTSKNNFGVK